MGSNDSKSKPVTPEPISTTVTVRTTVQTSTAALPRSEGESFFANSPEMFYLALAFISGVLSTLLVVAVVCLIRKRYKRSQENLQEQVPSKAPCEESAENQNEVSYASVVVKPRLKAAPV